MKLFSLSILLLLAFELSILRSTCLFMNMRLTISSFMNYECGSFAPPHSTKVPCEEHCRLEKRWSSGRWISFFLLKPSGYSDFLLFPFSCFLVSYFRVASFLIFVHINVQKVKKRLSVDKIEPQYVLIGFRIKDICTFYELVYLVLSHYFVLKT